MAKTPEADDPKAACHPHDAPFKVLLEFMKHENTSAKVCGATQTQVLVDNPARLSGV